MFLFDGSIGEILDFRYTLEGISEKLEPPNLFTRARPDLESISDNSEHPTFEVSSGSSELEIHEACDDRLYRVFFIGFEPQTLFLVLVDLTCTVDARH